jgi:hypothetical protein
MRAFHELLNDLIGTRPGRELKTVTGMTAGYITQIKNGTQVPTDATITAIAARYAPERLGELLYAGALARLKNQQFSYKSEDLQQRAEDLKRSAVAAFEALRPARVVPEGADRTKKGRTFNDFPEAFFPLAVVTGDKREDRGAHIGIADFGAYSATPADTRWILDLGLREGVVKHIDKNFLLLSDEQLRRRFARMNLLVIGSPASNHLARQVNSSAVFRFNYSQEADDAIRQVINKAKDMTKAQLTAYQQELRTSEQIRTSLPNRMRSLFTGGIFDPTYPGGDYVAAKYAQIARDTQFDFGMLTFCVNPFYEEQCRIEKRENDHKYVAIMAAGIHHPATAHAVRQLGRERREQGIFAKHPYGGLLRVELDLECPFSERTELAQCRWEDEADDARKPPQDQRTDLVRELGAIAERRKAGELKILELDAFHAIQCLKLVEHLSEQTWEYDPEAGVTQV